MKNLKSKIMEKTPTVYDVKLKGQLTVNLPVIIIIFVALLSFLSLNVNYHLSLFISIILGWTYWSFSVKRWIEWAVKNNVSEEKILKIGKKGFLIWSENTIKTVVKDKKHPFI